MEFRLAAEGNVEELRAFLRKNPDRVNALNPATHFSLLYTTVLHGEKKRDLLSDCNQTNATGSTVQLNKYFQQIQMLVDEFGADLNGANGGAADTILHLIAGMDWDAVLAFLLSHYFYSNANNTNNDRKLDIMKRNVFEDRPSQIAAREKRGNILKLLSDAEGYLKPSTPAPGAANPNNAAHRKEFSKFLVDDSDDEGPTGKKSTPPVTTTTGSNSATPPAAGAAKAPTLKTRPMVDVHRDPNNNNNNNNNNTSASTSGNGGSPFTLATPLLSANTSGKIGGVRFEPRCEKLLPTGARFHNADLQNFKTTFGTGFIFYQCKDHYEIKGLLPYTYKGSEYYAPVIICIYAPTSTHTIQTTSTGTGKAWQCYSRYRCFLNKDMMSGFGINRKAEYLDPVTGAFLASPADCIFSDNLNNNSGRSLSTGAEGAGAAAAPQPAAPFSSFVTNVVLKNFTAVPPMTVITSSYVYESTGPADKQAQAAKSAPPPPPPPPSMGPSSNNLFLLGTAKDTFRPYHSGAAPRCFSSKHIFARRNNLYKLRVYNILRDVSRFGDGCFFSLPTATTAASPPPQTRFIFDRSRNALNGFVPIYKETPVSFMSCKTFIHNNSDVMVSSQMAAAAGANVLLPPNVTTTTAGGSKKGIQCQTVLFLRLRIVFTHPDAKRYQRFVSETYPFIREHIIPNRATATTVPDHIVRNINEQFEYPPKIFLIDCLRGNPTAAVKRNYNHECFSSLMVSSHTGEVKWSALFDDFASQAQEKANHKQSAAPSPDAYYKSQWEKTWVALRLSLCSSTNGNIRTSTFETSLLTLRIKCMYYNVSYTRSLRSRFVVTEVTTVDSS
ncbi:hypothetical protein STCU_04631 [Strigomonas culicis]|uniref:Uncharacterized protein n=1 Tax=Strigomonas culicis TaxID=28005 RepID=S9UEP5_9TRYP|nr:hypothetical protein STCU_04631 [Strigomonas culicis]|eukprot:EPY29287.1 hypothetical protein STCU_04631 [Strigomonas culicis]